VSIKDLFDNVNVKGTATTASHPQIQKFNDEVESSNYALEITKNRGRFVPHTDYSKPSNFARFGSAEEYYSEAIKWVYGYYPYDGSLREKEEWYSSGSYLENYIFDNDYPRTNGYALMSADGWGTLVGSMSGGYGLPSELEYIQLRSGPNKENVWDAAKNREENLKFDLSSNGTTVEFWLKKDAFATSKTQKEVIFDLWNGKHPNQHDYGRLRIMLSASSHDGAFRITALSGTSGVHDATISDTDTTSSIISSGWTHYAFTLKNAAAGIELEMYKDGTFVSTVTTGSTINHVTGTLIANIGALRTPTKYAVTAATGSGKLSGSLDDFRYWKTRRTSRDIGRYYISQVGGGVNTDDATTDLGVYYKFNEGITGLSGKDSVVLDYSGRASNGAWTGYDTSSRNTDSAMVLSGKTTFEFKDPIMYAVHPNVSSLLNTKKEIGEIHDASNVNSMYKSIPGWITEGDEESNNELKKLTQIMGNYFDELYNQIENVNKIKDITYPSSSAHTGSFKPYPFAKRLLTSQGFNVPELFIDSTILEHFSSRDEKIKYEEEIYNVKNLIYQNIYNNLVYILKTKGTQKSINNLIRSFGANEDIIDVNVYAHNLDSELRKNVKQETIRKKTFDFNKVNRIDSTIYQFQTGSGTRSYISGSGANGLTVPITVECEAVFPKKINIYNESNYVYPSLTSSIFGQHTVNPSSPNDLTWNPDDSAFFRVYAIRDKLNSGDVYFALTGSLFSELTSSLYKEVYDNEKWNFAVRIRPASPFGDLVTSGSGQYKVEFYGVSQRFGDITNEFFLTSSMTKANGESFVTAGKRLYAGAHRTNFSGAILGTTDVKISSLRYWMRYIENSAIKDHATSMFSYGPSSPMKNSTRTETSLGQYDIPELETLALNWDFRIVSSSADSAGRFLIEDFSSGSAYEATRYGWIGNITQQKHSGRGDKFPANDPDVVLSDYFFTTRNRLPEQFHTDNMISIGEDSDKIFTRDTRPIDYYFSIENSLYRVISEEIINVFASVLDFNNLIGEPVNKYRKEYKDLAKLRQLFFERVENEPDVEKYLDYFKHVDSFIQQMLEQLVPASSNVSESVLNIIESHILERNKYDHKFPTMESKAPEPISTLQGINELLYNWKSGHAPIPANQEFNCTYWHELAERGGSVITSGDAIVDSQRETIKTVVNTEVSGSTYAVRKLGKLYRFTTNLSNDLQGGSNLKTNNLFGFHRQAIKFNDSEEYIKIDLSKIKQNKNCDEDRKPVELRKRLAHAEVVSHTNGESIASGDYKDGKANLLLPFTIFSSSMNTGYLGGLSTPASESFENMHRDVVGRNVQRPLQGPFTEKYVGGLQYRHAPINYSSPTKPLDTPYTRAEGWFIKGGAAGGGNITLISESFGSTAPSSWSSAGTTATDPAGWVLTHSGPTPSAGTGPNSAFDGTYYAYAETSVPNLPGKLYGLVTPKLDATDLGGPDFSASFYYHMHGVNVGSLKVQHASDITFATSVTDLTVNWNGSNATSIAGQQQANTTDAYKQGKIDLTQYAGTEFYLRFLYQGGITYLSDIALDAIQVSGTAGGNILKLMDPSFDDVHKMRAVYYRDEVAKRPLNIRNIKMTSSSPTTIGNYSKNYEVVNIPGRDINNIWFIQNSGNVATVTAESSFLSGGVDFSLANRSTLQDGSKNRTVIVEHFSAPGGPEVMSRGFLDAASETYSVYNCLNYRNSTVRNNLNLWNKHHSIFGGTSSYGTPLLTTGSFHKVQRNTGLRIEWEGGVALTGSESIMNVITASYYDNGFVTHQIPQTDAGYAWISGSITGSII
tara:strand:+ start:14522 stop:19900 length:5379 start_codon:yes stop_codon:yes gene_type:complete